jgi:hypothetical protein
MKGQRLLPSMVCNGRLQLALSSDPWALNLLATIPSTKAGGAAYNPSEERIGLANSRRASIRTTNVICFEHELG